MATAPINATTGTSRNASSTCHHPTTNSAMTTTVVRLMSKKNRLWYSAVIPRMRDNCIAAARVRASRSLAILPD